MKPLSFGQIPHVSAYTQYGLCKLTMVNKGENIFSFPLDFDTPTPYTIKGKGKLPSERRKKKLKKFQKGLDKRYPKAL